MQKDTISYFIQRMKQKSKEPLVVDPAHRNKLVEE